MKKFIARFLVVMLCAMLGIGVYATDSTVVTDTYIDSATSVSDSTEIIVSDEATFDGMIEALTNSALWTTIGLVAAAIIACIATFRKYFGFITDLISKKADENTINSALKQASTELSEVFNQKLNQIDGHLKDTDSNAKILISILTIFITNANINPNAKAEIMQYLTGIKDINTSVAELVETANRIIQEANEAEVKESTPALDAIIEEETDSKMVLG